jgi:hypothetical protein
MMLADIRDQLEHVGDGWAYRRAWSSNDQDRCARRVPPPLQLPSTPHRPTRPTTDLPHLDRHDLCGHIS